MAKLGNRTALKMLQPEWVLRVRVPFSVQRLCDTQLGS